MNSREDLRRHLERERIVAAYRELYDEVLASLQRHDPIGVADERPSEYRPETGTILPRLTEADSADELRRIIHEEFVDWRGAEAAGAEDRYQALARELWDHIGPRGA